MLRDLARGSEVVVPAWVFGVPLMAELAKAGVFERGFPPDSGDSVVIDFGDEWALFNVFLVRGRWQCVEDRDANPRELWLTDADLTVHTLRREAYYSRMAQDLGLSGNIAEVRPGIWEIGRKSLPGRGRSKVVFVENGVLVAEMALFVAQDSFRSFCVLSAKRDGDIQKVGDKTVVQSVITVSEGRFTSEVFEDLAASGSPGELETGVDLDSFPPKLVILGEDFPMPIHKGKPPIGLKYMATLMDRAREVIPVWELFSSALPVDTDMADQEDEDEDDPLGQDESVPAVGRRNKEARRRPVWEDEDMDGLAMANAAKELTSRRQQLESMLEKGARKGAIDKLGNEIAELEKYLNAGKAAGGRRRAIRHGDREKARDSVRNGFKTLLQHVAKRNPERAAELEKALNLGYEVMFSPPPDWGI